MNNIKTIVVLSILLMINFSSSLSAASAKAKLRLTSESGHVLRISEYETSGNNKTYISITFENYQCMPSVLKYKGSIDLAKIEWKSGSHLYIEIPRGIRVKKQFTDGVIKCGLQQVSVEVARSERSNKKMAPSAKTD